MSKRNTQKFIQHTSDIDPELREETLHTLVADHACSFDLKPDWCVWGRDQHGGIGLLYWIRTEKNSESIARCIAELITQLGGDARAEKTEWNETLLDDVPVYDRESVLDMLE